MSEYATGCASDHGSPGAAGVFGLPNRTRAASASAVTGFQAAIVCSGPGMVEVGTNVLATNVSGNSATNAMPVTPSGVDTTLPSRTPIQIMANANAISSP